MSRIRVPLAVDAQARVPLGPVQLPVRTCVALGVAVVPAVVCFELPVFVGTRLMLVTAVCGAATALATPTREGLWVGLWFVLRFASRWSAPEVMRGEAVRPAPAVRSDWRRFVPRPRVPRAVLRLLDPAGVVSVAEGLLHVRPGGWRAVVSLEGPPCATDSPVYARWCDGVIRWLAQLNCPAQLVTTVGHVDRQGAEEAFVRTCSFEPADGPLMLAERFFAGEMATRSLAFTHHVVLMPRLAGSDGLAPRWPWLLRAASRVDAEHVLASALSSGRAAGLAVERASAVGVGALARRSVVGADRVEVGGEGVVVDGDHVVSLAITRLGPDADHGMLVDVLQRSGMQGCVSVHLLPAARAVVRKKLTKRRMWLRYAMREGRPDIDLEVSLADTEQLQAQLAAGHVEGLRVSVAVQVRAPSRTEAEEDVEKLVAILGGHGWGVERVTVPPLPAACLAAPGAVPLRRATLLTTDAVASRLLPALGTPFASIGDPLVGLNLRAGSSAYLSVFTRPNFNTVIVGSSGSGKSVAAKTLLIRHVLRGAGACVLDPDSEYAPVVRLLGGRYHELSEVALNPLSLGVDEGVDLAAGRIVPVLSVMAGDETEYVGGRPIRRLPNEDKAWLHVQLLKFLGEWRARFHREPVLSDLIDHLQETALRDRSLPPVTRERYRRIVLRLSSYTQGALGEIFDRPSSFDIEPGAVTGIGFRSLSLAYAADLTPALCVVLSHVLDAILTARSRMIVLVDEAHVLTSDPDAGQVLEQLVRRARKCRAGVWMASQRIEEFTATDLGRTLASTAATKLVLGHEDTVADQVRRLFELAEDEVAALTPPVPGQGVLIAGSERTVVRVIASELLWPFVSTSEEVAA